MPFDKAAYWAEYRKKNANRWTIKRTPLKSKPVKINPVSKRRAKELRVYEKEKAIHFEENPVCQWPGCECEIKTLHHAKGRIGKLLTNRKYFKTLCPWHHDHAEMNPIEAKALGLSVDRLTKN